MNNGIFPLLKLSNLNKNLLAVILLALNVTVELADLVLKFVDYVFVLFVEFLNLLKLIGLLRCELFFIFHLKVITDLLAILILALHSLKPRLEVF